MREGLVRLRHFVGLLTFFNGHTLSGGGIHQFTGKFFRHRATRTAARRLNEPAHRQCVATIPANIYRNLIGCTTDTARLYFNCRRCILKRLLKYIKRGALLLRFNVIERIVNDALCQAALPVQHQFTGEASHISALVLCIWYIWPPHDSFTSWHSLPPHQRTCLVLFGSHDRSLNFSSI